jgi:HEAT repeat protein
MSLLADIKLTDEQQVALKEKLDAWKINEKKKLETELTEKYEIMESNLKDEYEDLVSNVKDNMKKVYTKRFTKALGEMYKEIKAQVIVEHLDSPEVKALEEMKTIIYPLINESTAKRHRDEFKKLAEMYQDAVGNLDKLKGEVKKGKLVEALSPEVRKVVTKLLGEGNEEEIVEKFATIKQALKEEVNLTKSAPATKPVNEDIDFADDYYNDDDNDYEPPARSTSVRSTINEDTDIAAKKPEDDEFARLLDEQLILSGLKKSR